MELGLIGGELRRILEEDLPKAADTIDRDNRIPEELIEKLKEAGAFDPRDLGELMESVRLAARSSPAVAHLLLINGTAKLSLGGHKKSIVAVSITEPGGGSDLKANLKTVATIREGKTYVSGFKVFTSNAIYADLFIVLAIGKKGPTLFLIKRDERVEVEPMDLTTMRGAGISAVRYNDAEAKETIGEEGKGIREALKVINAGRLGYAVIGLGIAEGLLKETISYTKERVVFGRSIIEHQGPKWMIAEIYTEVEALRAYVEKLVSKGLPVDPLEASIAKILGAKVAQRAAWISVQLQGGRGLAKGSLSERLSRDARALDIGEGAREVLLDFIGSKVPELL